MPNIMVTQRCNLRCPYCFANEFVDGEKSELDITVDNFKRILDFILQDGTVKKIGLIGGEPTLHPQFDLLLKILSIDDRIEEVIIYTNGIKIKNYIDYLTNKKFHLLINCNDIENKITQYKELVDSIKCVDSIMKNRIVLGVNYYKKSFNYSFLWELLKYYHGNRLRVSISVPNTSEYNYSPLEYFKGIKAEVLIFFQELKLHGIIPFLDCNIFPACLITYEDLEQFEDWGKDNPLMVLKTVGTNCCPVIDILPDCTAVRCFGLSEYTKVDINNFSTITDLRNYYLRTIDAYAANSTYDSKCNTCYKFKTMKCSGGCLIYKIDKILRKQQQNEY